MLRVGETPLSLGDWNTKCVSEGGPWLWATRASRFHARRMDRVGWKVRPGEKIGV